ncbi:MAG: hypothetical protein MRK00_07895 [Nitrosomonas sp.]|nr:hypothetical protein [Nitrosomonas sp.]
MQQYRISGSNEFQVQKKPPRLSFFWFALFALTVLDDVRGESVVSVPVRFHIVTDLNMQKNGLQMRNWVSSYDIEHVVIPEVNRIWRKAGISFELERILHSRSLNPTEKARLLGDVVQSRRDSRGKSDPRRIKKLNKLINQDNHNPDAINIYLVPYLGEKSQGNAKPKRRRILIGQWTDKASRAESPPEKFQLTEASPFRKGSLSRTIAHEIGHVLGLKHPDKNTQTTYGLLMGGKKAGYDLTREEIQISRERAIDLLGY